MNENPIIEENANVEQVHEQPQENILEKVVAESDRANIKSALKAFVDYIACKKFYSEEKRNLQQRINSINSSISGAKDHVETFSISDKAITMAESLSDLSAMDRLFIHFCSSPDGLPDTEEPVTENQVTVEESEENDNTEEPENDKGEENDSERI